MTFEKLLTNPAAQSLGWAILHFIWQGTLLAAVLLIANLITKSARIRYATGCAVMLMMPVAFLATILRSQQPVPSAIHHIAPAPYPEPLSISVAASPGRRVALAAPVTGTAPAWRLSTIPGWLACLWLAGVIALSLFTTAGWLRTQQLTKRGTEPVNPIWLEIAETLKRRLKISKPVRLCASVIAEVPTVIGWVRPYILIPVSAITGLDEPRLRAILAHELAHIRRHDYLMNLLQNAIETLLFYHPAVWWVSRQIRQEREHCCDDLAVEVCGDVIVYASALAQLEEQRSRYTQPALAATGGDLLARIRRLMGQRDSRSPGQIAGSLAALATAALTTAALVVTALIGIGHAPAIHAQSPPVKIAQALPAAPVDPLETAQVQQAPVPKTTPIPARRLEFEVASIRPASPLPSSGAGRGRGGSTGGGVIRCGAQKIKFDKDLVTFQCVDLRALIQFAYGIVHPSLLTGPAWLMGQRFDIEAKPPQGATQAQLPEMIQSLLWDRFRLAIHWEPQEQPVNALVVDKGGLKLNAGLDAGSQDSVPPGPDPETPCPPQAQTCSPTIRNLGGEPTAVTPLAPGIESYSSPSIGTAVMTHPHPARPDDPKTRIEAPDTTIRGLADLLQTLSFQPVVDMTGLNGRYSITLEMSVDRRALVNQALAESPAAQAALAGGPISGSNAAVDAAFQNADDDFAAAFQKALQNALLKLGLRLEQRKAPVDTLIVDHVEKLPTDN